MAGRPKSKPKYLVFISHSKQDRWIARQISDLIEQKGRRLGISTFLDEKDIESGESIHESVRENIRSRDELVVLLSSHSVNRPWVLIEMALTYLTHRAVNFAFTDFAPMRQVYNYHNDLSLLSKFDRVLDISDLEDTQKLSQILSSTHQIAA